MLYVAIGYGGWPSKLPFGMRVFPLHGINGLWSLMGMGLFADAA